MRHESHLLGVLAASLIASARLSYATTFTNGASADAFVRAYAANANYGGAGSVSVSGSTATNGSGTVNGIADTFIRFNTVAMVNSFDSAFGPGNWVINRAVLRVTEAGAPANNLFTRGKGAFEIRWISNDDWAEGTGTPTSPTGDGIVYTNEPELLTNAVSLGIFTNAAANSTNSYSLALPQNFLADLRTGGEVGLYLTAIDSTIGFTFNSRSFGTATQRPFLEVSAVRQPGIAHLEVSDSDVVLSGTNGAPGQSYIVLCSTNASLPFSQWTPVVTNVINPDGTFSITATNDTGIDPARRQFFIVQMQ